MDRKRLHGLAMIVGVPLAVAVGSSPDVWAALTVKRWSAGDTLSASDLNASFDAVKSALVTERVASEIVNANTGTVIVAIATCPAGKTVLGGGCIYDTMSDNSGMQILEGYPSSATTFTCKIYNNTGSARAGQAFAICAGF